MGKTAKQKNGDDSKKAKQKNAKSNKTWCTVCQIWISNTVYNNHLNGKKHLGKMSFKNRMQHFDFTTSKKGVIIESLPSPQLGREVIHDYFRQFGDILAVTNLKSGDVLVQYQKMCGAKEALKTSQHVIQGTAVTIKSRKMNKASESDGAEPPSCSSKIVERLEKHFRDAPCGSLDEQVYQLVSKLQASEKLKTIKAKIVSDMSDWLLLQFPHHVLHMFGSSAMNLDLEDHSDMDLYLEYEPDSCMIDSQEVKLKRLKTAANVLSAHPDVKHSVVVKAARVPVGKFLHRPSGIHFDLICDNMKGVKNSEFIASLQTLDPRIRPFLLTLKLWAKAHKLVGNPQITFTSYALTLLGIFYLQKTEPPLVQPIASLQSSVPASQRTMLDGWNFSYVLPQKTTEKEQSPRHSIIALLKGFFDFYQSFDPKDVVVCPLLGDVVSRENFTHSPPALDQSVFETYFKYLENEGKPFSFGQQLAVQDPFELNFNVSSAFQKYDVFQSVCKKTLKICCQLERVAADGKPTSIPRLFGVLASNE